MPRYIKKQIGYCQRTGFKVKACDLVRDQETGMLVEEGWEDAEHPQKYLPTLPTPPARLAPSGMLEPAQVTEIKPLPPADD